MAPAKQHLLDRTLLAMPPPAKPAVQLPAAQASTHPQPYLSSGMHTQRQPQLCRTWYWHADHGAVTPPVIGVHMQGRPYDIKFCSRIPACNCPKVLLLQLKNLLRPTVNAHQVLHVLDVGPRAAYVCWEQSQRRQKAPACAGGWWPGDGRPASVCCGNHSPSLRHLGPCRRT
jgi:hypothetical protein